MNGRRSLARVRAPDEVAAEERAWNVVRSAYRERPAAASGRSRWRLALVPVLAVLVTGAALSPAGATVSRLIRQALGVPHAARALFSLPAPGRLLLSGPGGTWAVSADGSSRRLGVWRQASWSPHGLYIVAARGNQLAALDPRGLIRWQIARPAVSDPSWYGPSGYRVAYLSAHQLRVIAGDGTGDHLLAGDVAHVAPVWRSGHPYQLSYVDGHGMIVVQDAGSGRVLWRARAAGVRSLQWSENGERLLALTPTAARIYGATGRLLAQVKAGPYVSLLQGSLSPNGSRLALVRGGVTQDVAVVDLASGGRVARSVLSGAGIRQVVWAPDNRWLLVSWPAADQWVFLRVAGAPRVAAVSHINQQFGAWSSRSTSTRPQAPKLEGWCCTASGSPG
jgi:hypothetical protein